MEATRRCIVLRGTKTATRDAALARLSALHDVLWVGEAPEQSRFEHAEARGVRGLLGRSFDAVVLDAHRGIEADLLGQCHGLVWGGGALVLRLPPPGEPWASRESLAVVPYGADQVGGRFEAWMERALARAPDDPSPLRPPSHARAGHEEQAAAVQALVDAWSAEGPSRLALLADRGRGKSSALGLAIAELRRRGEARIVVSAAHPAAVAEVFRFGTGQPTPPDEGPLRFASPVSLAFDDQHPPADLIVVDEAAQLPVPVLRRLVERHPDAHLVFSTTTHGYEGTGRGFSLRFLAWLERGPVPLQRLRLRAPIRWAAGDPLERWVFEALLLDAEPAGVEPSALEAEPATIGGEPAGMEPEPAAAPTARVASRAATRLDVRRLDRDALLADPPRLRELFGLLVHAHYRTTPGDLHRLLDAPNLHLHALLHRDRVVAATVVAEEGSLPPALVEQVLHGRTRLRAHALADALVAHLGEPAAGPLPMIRSVRIATHPALRRQGLATQLVEHVHQVHQPALFGTLFGATPELLAFRRSLGYQLVRVSASRGARTGEPSVMMLRPADARARALVASLRAELARDLPRQLELLHADGETLLDPALHRALLHGLPPPAPLPPARRDALVRAYAHGPRTFESVALALLRFVQAHPRRLDRLDPAHRRLVQGRVVDGLGWRAATAHAGLPSVAAAMRALRRAVRPLVADDPPTDRDAAAGPG